MDKEESRLLIRATVDSVVRKPVDVPVIIQLEDVANDVVKIPLEMQESISVLDRYDCIKASFTINPTFNDYPKSNAIW